MIDNSTAPARVDILTVMGMAVVAYILSGLLHEGLGHGGACLAVGARPLVWGAYYFSCDTDLGPDWKYRVVAAAGSTVNLVACSLTWLLLAARLAGSQNRPRSGWTVFLWLVFAINGFGWAGYFLFSGVSGIGDWGVGPGSVLTGLPHAEFLRAGMSVVGGVLYLLIAVIAARGLGRIVGGERRDIARKLTFTAYFTGGAIAMLIGLLNPVGIFVVLASAAASTLGGTSGLLWTPELVPSTPTHTAFNLPFDWRWIAAGAATAAVYALVLGRSLELA